MAFHLCVLLWLLRCAFQVKAWRGKLALKWLFSSVCSVMPSQIKITGKGFWAKLALKWLFTSVCLVMPFQIRVPKKRL
uniref:Putative homeobox transcription factor sip1 n=1 Tax=Ixodes ricinus TaxID=34613 RepID=A0A147BTZ5_IXORI